MKTENMFFAENPISKSLKKACLLTVWFFSLFLFHNATAQEFRGMQELLEDTIRQEDYFIPLTSISAASEETAQMLRSIEDDLEEPSELPEIDSLLEIIQLEISDYEEILSDDFLMENGIFRVVEFRDDLQLFKDRIDSYNEVIEEIVVEYDEHEKRISQIKTIWEQTRSTERISDLSEVVKDNVDQLIKRINSINEQLNSQISYYLELQIEFNNLSLEIDDLLTRIAEAEKKVEKDILIPDSKPLWRLYVEADMDSTREFQWRKLLRSKASNIQNYHQLNQYKVYLWILIIVIFQYVFYKIRNLTLSTGTLMETPSERLAIRLLRLNIATGLLFALFLIGLLSPNRPAVIDNLQYILALIPLFFVFNIVLTRKFAGLNVFLLLIFLMIIISDSFIEFRILYRFLFLILSTGMIIFSMLVFLILRRNKLEKSFFYRLLRFVTILFLILSVISFLANLTGNFSLVMVLVYGISGSIFAGLIIYVLYHILSGILIIFLKSDLSAQVRIFRQFDNEIRQRTTRVLRVIAYLALLIYILRSFRVYKGVRDYIINLLSSQINLGDFSFSLGDIFLFILIILVSNWLSRLIRFILGEQVFFSPDRQKDTGASISSLVSFTIITVGFIIAVLAIGFEIEKLTILLSAFGVGIGFGLQNIFNNLVSGIIMAFEKPLQVGDTIEVGTLIGTVKKIGIRSSTVRTFDGSEVIVPNGNLISKELINWTLSDQQRRMIIQVGVRYGTDPKKVIDILVRVAEEHDKVISWPKPYVLFTEFGDSALNFELRCWTDDYDNWIFIASDLHVQVNDALKAAGIVIPFPQRDIHIIEKQEKKKE